MPQAPTQKLTRLDDEPPPALWRNRDFNLIMTGRTFAAIGANMTGLAMMMLAFDLTRSSQTAGFVTACVLVGDLMLSLPAGVVADRWDKKKIMIATAALQAVVLATIPLALLAQSLTVVHLCVVGFLIGGLTTFYGPAETSALKRIVHSSQLGTAMSVNQARGQLATIVGQATSGFLYGTGRAIPIIGEACAQLFAAVLACFIKTPLQPKLGDVDAPIAAGQGRGALRRMVADVAEGILFLWRHSVLRAVFVVACLANFGFNLVFTSAFLGLQRNGVPASALGSGQAVIGVSGLLGALFAPLILKKCATGWLNVITFCWVTVCATALLVRTDAVWVFAVSALCVFPLGASNSGLMAYFMHVVPDELQGRAMSALGMFAMALIPLGTALAGVLVEHGGWILAVGSGVAVSLLTLVLIATSKPIRSIPKTTQFGLETTSAGQG